MSIERTPPAASEPARRRAPGGRPAGLLLALEPRLMFDGAGAATAGASADATPDRHTAATTAGVPESGGPVAMTDAFDTAARLAQSATSRAPADAALRELAVVDASLPDIGTLIASLREGIEVVLLDPSQDGLAQIARAIDARPGGIDALHVLTHGSDGQLRLGATTLDAASLEAHRASLDAIADGLASSGDLLLYACDLAAGPRGAAFLHALGEATRADVAASSDATGAAALGGDWTLEAATGPLEADVAVRDASAWAHLMPAVPSVTLSVATPNVLIGETFRITATFDNAGTTPGYGPYVDLFVPSRGADGGASPDGVTIDGASYFGQPLNVTQVVLTAGDVAARRVAHPYARDTGGSNLVTIPAGFVAGDRLVVIEMPFGSYAADQPTATITIDARLSPLADVGTALQMVARAGLRYGADPLDNPSTDPTLQGATTSVGLNPSLYRLTTTYIGTEDETATGPNFVRAYRVDVDVADGQTLRTVELSTVLDPAMRFTPIAGTPASVGGVSLGAAPAGGWTNVGGVLVSAAATAGAPDPAAPGGTVSRTVAGVTGTTASADLSMVVGFHVPRVDAAAARVLDAASGDDRTLTLGTAMAASWTPSDARDASRPVAASDAAAHRLNARSIAIQKVDALATDARGPGLGPGDVLAYRLDAQVSDFFAFGDGATPLRIVDTLSDGLDFLDATNGFANPTLSVVRSGGAAEAYTLVRGVHYGVVTDADGRQTITFDLAAALPAGTGQVLVGDLFADAAQSGATTATLRFSARVLDAYRVAPPDAGGAPRPGATQRALNEADRLVNVASVEGTVLDAALDPARPGLRGEADGTTAGERIAPNAVSIVVYGVNGVPVTNDPANPVRIAPGDRVTYLIRYTVPTGDFEQFDLSAYLPLPLFDVADPDADGTPSGFSAQGGAFDPLPPTARFSVQATGGDGTGVAAPAVTALPGANGLRFFFGDRSDATDLPLAMQVAVTVTATDAPFADGLYLTAQSQAGGRSTASEPVVSQSIDRILTTVPTVQLSKGVVQDDVVRATSTFDPVYAPGDPRALVDVAGSAAARATLGTIGTAQATTLDANVAEVDAGDTLRIAIVAQNRGQSARGAFDLTLRDDLAAGLDPASVSNLRISRGDGTIVYDGTAGTLANLVRGDGAALATPADAITALFGPSGLQLVDDRGGDGVVGTADDVGALGGAVDRNGVATPAGSNVLVLTYDARLLAGVEAGSTRASSATLTNYAGTEGGADFTAVDPTDAASIRIALPALDKTIVATSEPAPITTGLDAVIGERVQYEVVVAVPEGTTSGARIVDTLPPRMSFVSIDTISASPGLVFSTPLPLPGAIVPVAAGGDANRIVVDLGTITNADTANAARETITLRYTAVVDNEAGNLQGTTLANTVQLASAQASVSDAAPALRVVEPAVTTLLSAPVGRYDAGDVVPFTLRLTTTAGRPPAQDVALEVANVLPAGLVYQPGTLQLISGPAQTALAFGGAGIVGAWTALQPGDVVVIRFDARITDGAQLGDAFDQTATVRWSSLPGTGNGNLSPFASSGDAERTGSLADPGGAQNTYVATDAERVSVTPVAPVLRLVASSEPSSPGTTVVPGEVVRYRMVVQVPEGSAPGAELRPQLPAGLRFVADGTATVAFVADGGGAGIDSTLLSGAQLDVVGGGTIAATIAGLAATQRLPTAAIVDAGGTPLVPGTVMPSGAEPRILLGDLANADRDANAEFVVVEFNAIVDNAAGNVRGDVRATTFDWSTGGVARGTSNTITVTVGEPSIVDVDKQLVAVSGNQVTFEVTFSNSGDQPAHDLRLLDPFAGEPNLVFGGAAGVTGVPGGASNASTADTLDVRVPVLAPGASVSIRYVATVVDVGTSVPSRNATVTFTSLSAGGTTLPVSTDGGTVSTTTTGERTGSGADYGGAANTYVDADGAGLSKLRGTLWDDTTNADGVPNPGEARLQGVPLTLVHAGRDGAFGTADDRSFSTVTDASGNYLFGVLPVGAVRIAGPTTIANGNGSLGELRARIDVQGAPTDATIALAVGEGQHYVGFDIGYVQVNHPPTVAAPASLSAVEDVRLPIAGVSVADPDAGTSPAVTVTLTIGQGRLDVAAAPGVVATGNGTASIVLTGAIADLNATLATLGYVGAPDFNGADLLTIRVDDRGATGDADGDLVPNEPVGDNLFAIRTVPIAVAAVNDAPVARPDARATLEDVPILDGRVIAGSPGGDVADTDVDGGPLSVQGVVAGGAGAGPLVGGVGSAIATPLGTLTLQADGTYVYVPGVELAAGATAQDVFTYTVSDGAGGTATTTLTITILVDGVNDTLTAVPDTRTTTEDAPPLSGNVVAGNGVAGGQPGDVRDPDPDNDLLTVTAVDAGPGRPGTVGAPLAGTWGTLTLGPDGRYTYATNAAAQLLAAGQSVQDVFGYTVSDGTVSSTTTLTITVVGANDAPVARPDQNRGDAAGTTPALGNVIAAGAPTDLADGDLEGDPLRVQGVRPGADPGTPVSGGVATPVAGRYGTVTVGADGRYVYLVDPANPAVVALRAGESLTDVFDYTIADPSGATATTTLTILVDGANDTPSAGRAALVVDAQQPPGSRGPALPAPPVADPDNTPGELRVRIDAIDRPQAGTFLLPDGTPLAPGQTIAVDVLQRLTYLPAPGYSAPPSADGTLPGGGLAFTVFDPSGAGAPGRIDIAIRQVVGLPPSAPPPAAPPLPPLIDHVGGGAPGTGPGGPGTTSLLAAIGGGLGGALAGGPLGPGAAPSPPAAPPLIDLVGGGAPGTTPLLAAIGGGFGGVLAGGPLGPGGPGAAPSPAAVLDTVRSIPGPIGAVPPSEAAMLSPYPYEGPRPTVGGAGGELVGDTVRAARDAVLADAARLAADTGRLDLDADGLVPSNRVDGFFGDERIGPLREAAAPRTEVAPASDVAPPPAASGDAVARDEHCEPVPKPKPKPVKRILSDGLTKPAGSFTEQIDAQKKKFKPPAKVVPKPLPTRQC
jgi:fimbrial isopeptide formation D2 family protein